MPPSRANGDDAAKSCARLAAASPLEEHGVAVGLAAAEDDDAAGAVEAVEVGSADASPDMSRSGGRTAGFPSALLSFDGIPFDDKF